MPTIKERPSNSAANSAFARAAETLENPRIRVCIDPYAKFFLPPRLALVLALPYFRYRLLSHWEMLFPGVANAVVARGRFMDDCLEGFLAKGAGQVVLLGAGYDTRAYRFEKLKEGPPVFEVDLPDTQRIKKRIVERIFGRMPFHVRFVSVDFQKANLAEELARHGFDRNLRTLFLWEGVTYYLNACAIDGTLCAIGELGSPGSRLVFDFFPASVADGICDIAGAKALAICLDKFGEKICFGIEPEMLGSFLSAKGLVPEERLGAEQLRRRYFRNGSGRSVSRIFHIAVARIEGTWKKT